MEKIIKNLKSQLETGGYQTKQLSNQEIIERDIKGYNKSIGELKGYDCKICKNKGHIAKNTNGYFTMYDCECLEKRKLYNNIKKSGLENQIKSKSFDNYIVSEEWQKQLKDKSMEYINSKDDWFFIGGQAGTGKTHLCTSIIREVIQLGNSAKYMLWQDDIKLIKNNINEHEIYNKKMEEYKSCDYLYIDDFFVSGTIQNIYDISQDRYIEKLRPTQADINIAFEIINYRYNDKNKKTIISSNLLIDEILDISEIVGSRIYEKSKKYNININADKNKNYRIKKG